MKKGIFLAVFLATVGSVGSAVRAQTVVSLPSNGYCTENPGGYVWCQISGVLANGTLYNIETTPGSVWFYDALTGNLVAEENGLGSFSGSTYGTSTRTMVFSGRLNGSITLNIQFQRIGRWGGWKETGGTLTLD